MNICFVRIYIHICRYILVFIYIYSYIYIQLYVSKYIQPACVSSPFSANAAPAKTILVNCTLSKSACAL